MGDPWGIVLVPTEAGRGLLAIGRSLAIVPGWDVVVTRTWCPPHIIRNDGPDALPLWWSGALVPEGWDRYVRALLDRMAPVDDRPVSRYPTCAEVEGATKIAVDAGLCRVAVLDLVDGRIVERGQ